ncbi:MAG: T9SS type A sorting domain-containing protein, partial [Rhodothermia bacterium]|nr:T9SS type A sorting domain-containing protein [Rhodothermia bacterium]
QEFVTATATDLDGNTSEFSACAELAPEPALRIRVMFVDDSDNLVPAVRQSFQVGRWEPNGANDPFQWVATETSDDDGVIAVRADGLEPGDPVVVRSFVHTEPAVKINHQDVEDIAHEIFVDNLLVESTGRLATDEIDTNPAATTEVVLSHSTIVFNLLVSIQWKALDSYVAGLRAALRNASDYLYDVTNGQAQLGKISIYDNARLWNSADIQIHANNTLRDNADLYGWKAANQYVRLSPKSYGGGAQDRNDIFRDDPLDPNSVDNYRTIIHELGHYLLGFLDEYENAAGEAKHAGTNFGFMDYYYATGFGGSQALRSEMSMYVDASYRDVEQFEVYGKTSWQQFHDTYSNSYSGIVIPILTPEDYGAPFSEPYIPGPNEVNGSLDYPTGALMDISVSSQASDAAGKVLIIRDAQGRGLRNMDVTLGVVGSRRAPDCFIYQGQTTDRGEIRLLGADIRDVVTITGDIDGAYFGDALVIATTQESIVTIGPAAPGGLVSEVSSSANGDLVLTSSADWDLVEAPDIQPEAFCGTVPPVLRKIAVSTKRPGAFSWSFGAPPTGESTLRLGLTDAAGDSMVVHTPLSVHNFSPDSLATVSSASGFALELDSVATGVERIAVASARFPPPRQGLRDSLRLVSRVHSVDVFPLPSELDGYLSISYDTQESVGSVEDGIQIYRYANESWQPVETTLEFLNRKATVQFVETGTYAAFADLTVTGTAKEPSEGEEPALELRLYPNYPNPFTGVTEVSYELPAPGHARLAVYDLLGRRVRVLSDGDRDKGRHELTFDGAGLSSGIYILELRVGQRKLTQTMMLAR